MPVNRQYTFYVADMIQLTEGLRQLGKPLLWTHGPRENPNACQIKADDRLTYTH